MRLYSITLSTCICFTIFGIILQHSNSAKFGITEFDCSNYYSRAFFYNTLVITNIR